MPTDTPPLPDPAGNSRASQGNQVQFIITVGLRHWWIILGATVLALAAAAVFNHLKVDDEVRWTAHTTLNIRTSPYEREIFRDTGARELPRATPDAVLARVTPGLWAGIARAIVQHDLDTGGPWGHVATDEELADKARYIEGQAVHFEPMPNAGAIRVTAFAGTEERARVMAELAARVFVERARMSQLREEQETFDLIRRQIDDVRDRLMAAEKAEWEFQRESGFQATGDLAEDMARMQRELQRAKEEEARAMARLGQIADRLAENEERIPQALGKVSDGVIDGLFQDLHAMLEEELTMRLEFTPAYPPLQHLREEVVVQEQLILEALRELDSASASGVSVWEERQSLRGEYLEQQLRMAEARITQRTIEERLDGLVRDLPELVSQDSAFRRLMERTSQLRQQFNKLVEKEFEIGSAIERSFTSVERNGSLQAAIVAPPGRHLQVWGNYIVGGLIGLTLGFSLAIVFEMTDTSVRGIDDVTQHIGLEVIGTIPRMRFGGQGRGRRGGARVATREDEQVDACIVTRHDPKSPVSEAYRALRTNFQFATIQKRPRTVMVTSAVPGEGKTTTAVNLAVTMADRGLRVLVIDTDLRRPHVHSVLKVERGPGLADVLRSGLGSQEVVRPTRVENLWAIPSGQVPPNPSELLGSERMGKFMEEVAAEYDMVICDAPSILVVTDPLLLATQVDTCCLVVATERARRETIYRARRLLETANVDIAGVVLNGLEPSRRHQFYYYYYYYTEDEARQRKRRGIQV